MKTILNHLSSFTKKMSWISILIGATLGIPLWWTISKFTNNISPQLTKSWELAVGVILGGIVGWIFPEFMETMRKKWDISKPLCAILGPISVNQNPTVIFLGSLYPKDTNSFLKTIPFKPEGTFEVIPKTGMPWVVVENDARTLGYIMATMARVGKTDNINIVRDDVGLDVTDTNIICIGSIKNNHKTAQINNSFGNLPFKFKWDNDELIITSTVSEQVWKLDDEYDYGIFAKIPNEYDKSKNVYIFAGLSSYSTVGSAYYLYKKWDDIYSKVKGGNFAMIIKSRRDNFQYTQIEYLVEVQ